MSSVNTALTSKVYEGMPLVGGSALTQSRMPSSAYSSLQFLVHALSVFPDTPHDLRALEAIALPLLPPISTVLQPRTFLPLTKTVETALEKSNWFFLDSLKPITSRLSMVINKMSQMFSRFVGNKKPTAPVISSPKNGMKTLFKQEARNNVPRLQGTVSKTASEDVLPEIDADFDDDSVDDSVDEFEDNTNESENDSQSAFSASSEFISLRQKQHTNKKFETSDQKTTDRTANQKTDQEQETPLLLNGPKIISDFLSLLPAESREEVNAILLKIIFDLPAEQNETLMRDLRDLIKGQNSGVAIHLLKALISFPTEHRVPSLKYVLSLFQDLDSSLCQRMLEVFETIDKEDKFEMLQVLQPLLQQKLEGNARIGALNDFKGISKDSRKFFAENLELIPPSQRMTLLKVFKEMESLPALQRTQILTLANEIIKLDEDHFIDQLKKVLVNKENIPHLLKLMGPFLDADHFKQDNDMSKDKEIKAAPMLINLASLFVLFSEKNAKEIIYTLELMPKKVLSVAYEIYKFLDELGHLNRGLFFIFCEMLKFKCELPTILIHFLRILNLFPSEKRGSFISEVDRLFTGGESDAECIKLINLLKTFTLEQKIAFIEKSKGRDRFKGNLRLGPVVTLIDSPMESRENSPMEQPLLMLKS